MRCNKIFKLSLVFTLVLAMFLGSTNFASADSGNSALPPKDSPLHEKYYKMYAPKTQTTFKLFSTSTQPVDKIVKESSNLMLYGGALAAGGTFAGVIKPIEKIPYVGLGIRVATGTGSAMVIVGTFGQVKYGDFKSGSIVKHKTYFKWTNAARLEYAVKVESWVEYKGTKVSPVKTTNFSKSL